jgi:putative ABC transport system permease protein
VRWADLLGSAAANTRRGRVRTLLTVVAVFIGALALTLTSGMGTGVNRYIDDTVAAFGDDDALYVQKSQPLIELTAGAGPREYDPDTTRIRTGFGVSFEGLSADDVAYVAGLEGVRSVKPMYAVTPTYLESPEGRRFQLSPGIPVDAVGLQMVAGRAPAAGRDELVIPDSWVVDLGFASAPEAVGGVVEVVMTNRAGQDRAFPATVSGVTQSSLAGTSLNPIPSDSFNERLYEYQTGGGRRDVPESFAMATVTVDMSRAEEIQSRLEDEGLLGLTVEDQLGMFRSVIDAIVWILNACAVIALLAAGLGIINTLLMSVQERTREIGLMKAMGMSGGTVFGLFSLEAVVIGALGAVLGASAGVAGGSALSRVLAEGYLSGLPGLSLFAFEPWRVAAVLLSVTAIAFLAGTVPAVRAARKDPITSLRHE